MLARIDRALAVLMWLAAALVAVALFAGPKLIAAEKDTAGAPAAGATPTAGAAPAGEAIFTANCAGCHTLATAGASGAVGPNLDELKPDAATVEAAVTNGRGSMPSFKDRLAPADIAAVAEYVSAGG